MNLLDALPGIARIAGSLGNQPVQITFNPALPPEVRTQIATQSPSQHFTLTVSNAAGNQLTFTSPTGITFTATVNPPLPLGTQLQLNIADVLPQPNTPAQPSSSLPLQARILPPATPQQATPFLPQATPLPATPSATPTLTLPAAALTTPALKNLVTTTLLQATAPQAALPATGTSSQPLPVPAGPVAASLPATLTPSLISQPLTLTPTAPLRPDGTQPATLTAPHTPPVPIVLRLGVALPVNSPQPAMLVPSTAPEATQPTLLLTGPSDTQASPAPANLQIQVPKQTSLPTSTEPRPTGTEPRLPTTARILPPAANQPPGTQTALLATGATITLKLSPSTQPLPTGSIIVADLPITPTGGIQRVLTADSQTQPQPNTAQQSQAAAPVAPQTPRALLSPGMVVQGTITGQNEQGQPLLTLTAPPAMAGQVAALNLSEPNALLPLGANLSIRVENALTATILGLTLPPQTQAAFTVGTIGARWEGLQQALSLLQQQAPVQAANLRASLPQLANLLPGLIAFTNALRTNDPDAALDREATRILKSLGIDLSSDISQLSQLQQRPASHTDTQWRGTLFPYVEATGEDPRQGGFFWRREKSDDPRAATNTRFVVELEMSRLGALQLDGLVTYPDLWLKLRRTTTPEPGFTEGLQAMVTDFLTRYGLGGGIAVETTQAFPVNPRAELLAETDNPLPTSA